MKYDDASEHEPISSMVGQDPDEAIRAERFADAVTALQHGARVDLSMIHASDRDALFMAVMFSQAVSMNRDPDPLFIATLSETLSSHWLRDEDDGEQLHQRKNGSSEMFH